MSFSAVFVLIVIVFMLFILAFDKMRPGLTLLSVVILFLVAGIISSHEAIAGFSNKGMITVAILFLVSEGIRQSGGLNYFINKILPTRKTTIPLTLTRMLPSIAFISAFLNNTAVVIIFAPIIKKWADKMNLPATKFLIPLSYATILGGICTLIGTSTNLVVHGMMIDAGYKGLSMFEIGKVGVIIAVVEIAYLIIFANKLLPGDRILKKDLGKGSTKEYYYDVVVPEGSKLIGTKVRRNKFMDLPMMEVRSIKRNDEFIITEGRTIDIEQGDILVLAGKSDSVEYLLNSENIELVCLSTGEAKQFAKKAVKQIEVVVAPRFPGMGRTLKDFDFFKHYGAVVMAVHRNGERVTVDLDSHIIGDGDTFVLIADNDFSQLWGQSSGFYMISEIDDFKLPENKRRRWFAIGLLLFMIVGATFGEHIPSSDGKVYDMFFFSAITMVVMAWTKLFPAKKYTKYVSWDVLIAIAAAFAISKAMMNSGIADSIASVIIEVSKNYGAYGALFSVLVITMLFTEIITNNAAAALCFPISIAVAERLGVSPYPFFIAICVAASASFSTPIGYQTNLIVQGIGGYKFKDYLRIGIPMNIITLIISLFVIPLFWKF
ncbi:MAG: SLC13 family permease [Rikenellaceae bacterium]